MDAVRRKFHDNSGFLLETSGYLFSPFDEDRGLDCVGSLIEKTEDRRDTRPSKHLQNVKHQFCLLLQVILLVNLLLSFHNRFLKSLFPLHLGFFLLGTSF